MVTDKDTVVLVDRGLLDGSAYVSAENWQALMDDMGPAEVEMLEDLLSPGKVTDDYNLGKELGS